MKPQDGPGKCNMITVLVWVCGAIVMLVASVASSKWVTLDTTDMSEADLRGKVTYYGLWEKCTAEKCESTLEDVTSKDLHY